MKLTVGQKVILLKIIQNNRIPEEKAKKWVTITKVGRVWAETDMGLFIDMEEELACSDKNYVRNYSQGWSYAVFESEQVMMDNREQTHLNKLITRYFGGWENKEISLDKAREIAKILELKVKV